MTYAFVAIALWTLALNHVGSGAHMLQNGLGWLLTSRDAADRPDASVLEERLARVHRNHLENVVVFLPMMLLVEHLGRDTTWATTFAWVFLGARVAHLIFYAGGVPPLRSLSHVTNLSAHVGMALVAIGVIGF
jgi:uncharacterized MAPEG superfamily protein